MRPVIVYYSEGKGTQFWDCHKMSDITDTADLISVGTFDLYVHYFSFPIAFWKGNHTFADVCRNIGLDKTYPFMVPPSIFTEVVKCVDILTIQESGKVGKVYSVEEMTDLLYQADLGLTRELTSAMIPLLFVSRPQHAKTC
jgi:hypothetical protein